MLTKTEGKITYESVMSLQEMPYLHQVIHEALRLYPILAVHDRECTSPDGFSLEPFSDFRIPCGTPVYVPLYAMQRDEKYFPNPLKFDPERFAPKNADNIKPFTYFPFGAGQRSCIGERLGLMLVKLGIVKILKDFRLETTENTPMEIVLEKKATIIRSEEAMLVDFVLDPL